MSYPSVEVNAMTAGLSKGVARRWKSSDIGKADNVVVNILQTGTNEPKFAVDEDQRKQTLALKGI